MHELSSEDMRIALTGWGISVVAIGGSLKFLLDIGLNSMKETPNSRTVHSITEATSKPQNS